MIALWESGMVLLLAVDLASEVLSPGLSRLRCTTSCLLSKSTSRQGKPASSPRRSPVKTVRSAVANHISAFGAVDFAIS